jgi:murein DD-endopeptidase MepM/ murein hydrolase activator NlpD
MKVVIMPRERIVYGALSFNIGQCLLVGFALLTLAVLISLQLQRFFQPTVTEQIKEDRSRSGAVHLTRYADKQALDALFVQLGVLQANYQRLDALSRRVAGLTGLPPTDLQIVFENANGPTSEVRPETQPTAQVGQRVRTLHDALVKKIDHFLLLDLMLTKHTATIARQPTAMPIPPPAQVSSAYGWRRHPFHAGTSLHEGLDFAAPLGTPILAASGGVVRTATIQGGFGNLIEIDHGDGLLTRYAHAKVLLVKRGDLVMRGQTIARVGSTGLSTGPHLHFEVRRYDKPIDPRAYLTGRTVAPVSAWVDAVR